MSFCADDLVDVYIQKRVCGKAAFEKGTFVQDCYHEDSAIWIDWCGEVPLQFHRQGLWYSMVSGLK
jgi:hypothetical protein